MKNANDGGHENSLQTTTTMADGIDKNYDLILGCTKDEKGAFETDWHGMTKGVECINDATVATVCFPIIETQPMGLVDDGNGGLIQVPDENGKMLIADLRGCVSFRDHLETPESRLVRLHTPRKGYKVISNSNIWNAAKNCIKDVPDAQIQRVFTLETMTKFGVSISIGEREIGIKRADGSTDKTRCMLNVISSHDGTLACQAYDSTVRIVCMNTLRWSLEAAGEVGFKVYHTAGADTAMAKFPELVNAILTGRASFKNQMEYFDTLPVSKDDALYIALAYLESAKPKKKAKGEVEVEADTSTRLLNSAEEIQRLFALGKGNQGKTVYDLLNGATEYWTSGDGTGQNSDMNAKAYKADYGKAADHKSAIVNFLMGDLVEIAEKGRKLYVDANA